LIKPSHFHRLGDRLVPVAPWVCGVVTALPLLFVGWLAADYVRNAPFWDEFVTALDFLVQYRQAPTWSNLGSLLLAGSVDYHRILTSRLIYFAWSELPGGIDFAQLAILGNLFGVAAVVVIAWQQPDRALRWLLGAVLGLLLFQVQHYENLFQSYASIDHFHVVLQAAVSLALLARGGRAAAVIALAAAMVAAFTLAHGLAVFPAGALLLAGQRRWRSLAGWAAGAVAAGAFFLWGFPGVDGALGALATPTGWFHLARFWLTLLGGVPALGWAPAAPVLGAIALGLFGWLLRRGAFTREPFLCALAACILIATVLIAYGRFNVAETPALGSRYMVQSAVLWAALTMLALKARGDDRAALRAGLAVLPVFAVFNVAANLRFFREARFFAEKRITAVRHYDKTGTFANSPYAIFPHAGQADQIVARAAAAGLFHLRPQGTPLVDLTASPEEVTLPFHFDELAVGLTHIHLRGWLLPPSPREASFHPHAIIRAGDREIVARGRREYRPDVARALQRPDANRCGFLFLIPRAALPPDRFELSLALIGRGRALVTVTGKTFVNQRPP
jgi:hypothetical protein